MLHTIRNKDDLHRTLRKAGFELKPVPEMRRIRSERLAQQKKERLDKFKRAEYYRKRQLYVKGFRRDVMEIAEQDLIQHRRKDVLSDNYDLINQMKAVYKEELLEYARSFLVRPRKTVAKSWSRTTWS